MTEQQSRLDLDAALARLKALSTEPGEQAQIIELGSTAWAQGITPELMNVFGKIASTMRVTRLDMNRLATYGVNPLPLYEDVVKRGAARDPWLRAPDASLWVLTINDAPVNALATDYGTFAYIDAGLLGVQEINASDPMITAGHRVWPEEGDDK